MLSLFWCKNNNEHRHNQHLNDHAIHTTTPPSTTMLPPSSQLAILHEHRAVTISVERMKGAGVAATRARRGISRPKLPLEYLPPKTPAQNSRSNISRPNLPSHVVVLSEKGGGGGGSSPDWRIRGVTRPGRRNAPLRGFSGSASKEGGAKNGAGRKAERRAEPRLL